MYAEAVPLLVMLIDGTVAIIQSASLSILIFYRDQKKNDIPETEKVAEGSS